MSQLSPRLNLFLASWWSGNSPASAPTRAWWLAGLLAALAIALLAWQQRRQSRGSGASRPMATGRLVFDLTFVFIAFDNLPGLLTGQVWSPVLLVGLLAWRMILGGALALYWPGPSLRREITSWAVAEVAFSLGAVWLARNLPPGMSAAHAWSGVVVHAGLCLAGAGWQCWLRPRLAPDPGAATRWGLVLAVALVLTHPWFSPYLVGTGDARLYFEAQQDFFNQLKAGIWPPWVTQSEVAPFGAVFPFRLATYYFYFAALLNTLTADCLTTYAVQHLTIVLSYVAGGWVMLGVLRRLCPGEPWLACALAILYLASPAWLGPLYGFTMIFTTMALPFVPLALVGAWPGFGAKSWAQAIAHGAALAAVWHAHTPVGFWVSVCVLLGQVISWWVARPGGLVLCRQALAWAVCAVLCLGLWYSTFSLHFSHAQGDMPDSTATIMGTMRASFPAALLPASASPGALADIQLGYALAAALLVALAAWRLGRRQISVWLLPALLLVVFLLPIPWLTEHLWLILPKSVKVIAGPWPIQRLIVPLVTAATLAGMLGLAFFSERSPRGRRWVRVLTVLMLGWTAAEAAKYVRHGAASVKPAALSDSLRQRENSPLMSNWFAFHNHALPKVYVAETIQDAQLFNRVRAPAGSRILADNYDYVLTSATAQPRISLTAQPLVAGVWRLLPGFEFQGGRHYLLELTPGAQSVPGTFIMSMEGYQHSESGLAANGATLIQPIWTTAPGPLWTEFVFIPTDPSLAAKAVPDFLSYRVIPYDAAALPVSVVTYAPYRVTVHAPAAGRLETHRLFTEGYEAHVNGQPAAVTMSDDFRVMVPVPAGVSDVRLDYIGTPGLRVTFAVMGYGWLALLFWAAVRVARWWHRRRAA
jgi:hypothetical protein